MQDKMLKTIQNTVDIIAKCFAFVLAFIFMSICWLLYKTNVLIVVLFGCVVWFIYKIVDVLGYIFGWVAWIPSKISEFFFLFALDMSPQENKERIDSLVKETERKIEQHIKAAKSIIDADFRRGQENMQRRVNTAITNWFYSAGLPKDGSTAQTIKALVSNLPIEEEEEKS